jgi:Ca2+:H+ antiporter
LDDDANKEKMTGKKRNRTEPLWVIAVPLIAWILFGMKRLFFPDSLLFLLLLALGLIWTVLAAVHHAEVVAKRVGEPFGALVLAIAVTSIEVSLIISLMLSHGHDTTTLARDTVFATEMIIMTGIVGGSLFIGGIKFKEQVFGLEGVSAALTVLTAISVLTLILPNYTLSTPGPFYNQEQLTFVAIVSLILYGTFLLVQTISHRRYFLQSPDPQKESGTEKPPTNKKTMISLAFLLISLGVVVILAEELAPPVELGVDKAGAPKSLVGIIVAMIVLLPEGISALQAAKNNQLQSSLNLALGSALASIGLTIPIVAFVSLYFGFPLTLGIDLKSTVLFILSLLVILISLRTGRTTLLQGMVLLILFAVYLFITIIP